MATTGLILLGAGAMLALVLGLQRVAGFRAQSPSDYAGQTPQD